MAERKSTINSALVIFILLTMVSACFMFAMMLQQDDMQKEIEHHTKTIKEVDKEVTRIEGLIEQAEKDVVAYNDRNDNLKASLRDNTIRKDQRWDRWKQERQRVPGSWRDVSSVTKEGDQQYDRAKKTVKETVRSFEDAKKRLVDELASARKDLEKKKQQVKDKSEKDVKIISKRKARKRELEDKIARIKQREADEMKVEADGEIIAVGDRVTRFLSVNIGRVQGVRKGMKFSVFEEKLSGEKVIKGRCEVMVVRPTSSDCVLLPAEEELPTCPQCGWRATKPDLRYCVYCFLGDNDDEVTPLEKPRVVLSVAADRMNPIVVGDFISNPYFTPGQELIFVFGGETIFKSKREIKLFIEEHHGKLIDELAVDTDYLIAGTGPEADRLLKRARDIGVKVMKEEELYRFFGEAK